VQLYDTWEGGMESQEDYVDEVGRRKELV